MQLAVLALALAPQLATPTSPMIATGLHAPDVGPLVQGVLVESVRTLVFAGCFLALDDGDTCIEIAGHARDDLTSSVK